VAGSGVDVTIAHDGGEPVDAASILLVMSLGVPHGDEVTLEADGDDADRVLDELVALLARNLDEEP
jgi:phosphocarrier protein